MELTEDLVADFLTRKLSYFSSKLRYQKAEIGIVAEYEDIIVIVEVGARSYDTLIEPQQTVTKMKVKSIVICADFFMQESSINKGLRFDIISV